jgi:predicted AlkP superfamily pyrophosphatase or phosphodiesterase
MLGVRRWGWPLFVTLSGPMAAVACAEPALAPVAALRVTPPEKPVVVAIVIDQLAAWVASERMAVLPEGGGFSRLRHEGLYLRAMRYEHAVTDTAPGHASLYTGVVPEVSGIYANEVLAEDGEPESILRDDSTRLVASSGALSRPGASLARLRVETVADRLVAEDPQALVLSLSLKDRGALLAAGRHPTAALWLDTTENRFVSSTAVAPRLPAWARETLDAALRTAESATWTLLDQAWVASNAATPDAEAGEGDIPGFGTVFPHPIAAAKAPALAFRTSPMSDELLLSLGLSALSAEHAGSRRTLLALSLSANDYIGHTFGPDSWEAWDELERLDRVLATFLSGLDRMYGPDGYAVVLTGDHGTNPMPEAGRHAYCDASEPDRWRRVCGVAHRVLPVDLSQALTAVAKQTLGLGHWISGVSDPYVYLTPDVKALPPARQKVLRSALRDAIRATAGVSAVYELDDVPRDCPPFADESVGALLCRSVAPLARERGAAFYVVLDAGSFFDPNIVVGKGTSHGSPYVYDRMVPLFVRAPGRVAPGSTVDDATFDVYASTVAALLGVSAPNGDTAAPLVSRR